MKLKKQQHMPALGHHISAWLLRKKYVKRFTFNKSESLVEGMKHHL